MAHSEVEEELLITVLPEYPTYRFNLCLASLCTTTVKITNAVVCPRSLSTVWFRTACSQHSPGCIDQLVFVMKIFWEGSCLPGCDVV